MILNELLRATIQAEASDLHLTVGIPPAIRVSGGLIHLVEEKLNPADTEQFVRDILDDKEYSYYKSV
jgi:twitching motility protein PilT